MKKLLPKLLIFIVFFTLLFHLFNTVAIAQDAAEWVEDSEVTFAGKLATRSKDLLNWVIEHYQWGFINQSAGNPFDAIWITIRNIVYGVMGLFILVAAFLIITTRGKSLTIKRFIPRFIIVIVLVTLSFSLVQFVYQLTDIIQGFFLKVNFRDAPNNFISDVDLLHISFDYKDFVGYRRLGDQYDESVFVSSLMVKLTAITYYAMFIILIIRKIILWFFIVVSPIFPLLLMFYPLRNTAKIWTGEFFRWVLYGPLFAIFLAGLVSLWRIYIPLNLDLPNENPPADDSGAAYPTAISILLGGPKQLVTYNNSINTPDTFIEYLVALLMLWMVIIVPFILLKIFLDYFKDMNFSDNNIVKYLVASGSPLLARYGGMRVPGGGGGVPGPGGPAPAGSTGLAKELPYSNPAINEIQMHMQQTAQRTQELAEAYKTASAETTNNVFNNAYSTAYNQAYSQAAAQSGVNSEAVQAIASILKSTNIPVPTMRDVAKYESAMLSQGGAAHSEAARVSETLSRISGASMMTSPGEKEKFAQVRNQLIQQSQQGNAVASSILSAGMPATTAPLPERNRVQQVNVEDYEEVKKLWVENYKKMDVPPNANGDPKTRKEWVMEDIKQIPEVIELLLSGDPLKVNQGKEMVAKILPFLLLGGFSKEEIITYLKAKLEAAKSVLAEINQGEKSEEDQVEVEKTPQAKPKTLEMAAEAPQEPKKEQLPINDARNPKPSSDLNELLKKS